MIAERFRRLEVDDELEGGGLLDRQFARLRSFQNPVDISRRPTREIDEIGGVHATGCTTVGRIAHWTDYRR